MPKLYTDQRIEEDLKDLIETTFDTCSTNREEIYWLITLLRGLMHQESKEISNSAENVHLRAWQYQMAPITEQFLKKWRL